MFRDRDAGRSWEEGVLGSWDAVGVLRNWDAQREGCLGKGCRRDARGGCDAGELLVGVQGCFGGQDVREGLEGVCRKDGRSKGCLEGWDAGRMLKGGMLEGKGSGGMLRSQYSQRDA